MAFRTRPAIDRFNEKLVRVGDCLEWTAYVGNSGYGRFWVDGKSPLAHRWSYEYHKGPIPDGLFIDHLCRNKVCVNPDHLEPVTPTENVMRGVGPKVASARGAAVTACPQGHPYSEENTYRGGRGRTCATCKKRKAREYYERNRQDVIDRAAAWRVNNPERAREVAKLAARRQRAAAKNQAGAAS